jgi:hypothetical protein
MRRKETWGQFERERGGRSDKAFKRENQFFNYFDSQEAKGSLEEANKS